MAARIGLTGGIASGKSTAASIFDTLGVPVLSADALYHSLLKPIDGKPSPLSVAIATQFQSIADIPLINSGGHLDRKGLGSLVFDNPEQLAKLGAITHPAIAKAFAQKAETMAQQGVIWFLYDVPLLFENGLEKKMDGSICVWVDRHTQSQRLIQRDGLTPEQAEQRIDSQMPLDLKKEKANWVLDNRGSMAELENQVHHIFKHLESKLGSPVSTL